MARMPWPYISIVTPTYNMAHFLPECLESVRAQKYCAVEQIVVDGESTDGTRGVLEQYASEPWLKYLSERDYGQSDAINKGVMRCRGDVVSWLNADDTLCPGALDAVAAAFAGDGRPDLVIGGGYVVDRHGKIVKRVVHDSYYKGFFRHSMMVLQPAVFFTKSIFERVGGLDVDLEYGMDWDLLLKMEQARKIVYLRQPLARLRQHQETKTANGGWERARELAEIGFRHHGPRDRNWISFKLRSAIVSLTGSRRWVGYLDEVLVRCWGPKGYMIKGCPNGMGGGSRR